MKKLVTITAAVALVVALVGVSASLKSNSTGVAICHSGDIEIVIGEAAVQWHLNNHADCLGTCPCN